MTLSLWMTVWQEGKARYPMLHLLLADSPLIATMQRLAGANDLESLLHLQATLMLTVLRLSG